MKFIGQIYSKEHKLKKNKELVKDLKIFEMNQKF